MTQQLSEINEIADFFYHKHQHFTPSQRRRASDVLMDLGLSLSVVEQVLSGRRVSAKQLAMMGAA